MPQDSRQIVRWVFQQGNDLVTCSVDQHADAASDAVSIVCNGRTDAAIVERCDSNLVALQRHADIAVALKDRGWTLLSYTTDGRNTRRAPMVARHHAA